MRGFECLNDKLPYLVAMSAKKRLKSAQIAFFDNFLMGIAVNTSSDELFCGGWVDVVGVP